MKNIFISMIGLEERVLGIFQKGITSDKYLFFINQEFVNDPRVLKYKKEILEKHIKGQDFNCLEASYYDPFVIIQEINKYRIKEDRDFKNINLIIDISTFNRQNLLILLRHLRKILNVANIDIIYTIPNKINQEITKGSSGYSNIPFFDGKFSIDKRKLLVLLVGYEVDRPILLWRELEPSRVILVEGSEPTSAGFNLGNKNAIEELRKTIRCDVVQASASDPA